MSKAKYLRCMLYSTKYNLYSTYIYTYAISCKRLSFSSFEVCMQMPCPLLRYYRRHRRGHRFCIQFLSSACCQCTISECIKRQYEATATAALV